MRHINQSCTALLFIFLYFSMLVPACHNRDNSTPSKQSLRIEIRQENAEIPVETIYLHFPDQFKMNFDTVSIHNHLTQTKEIWNSIKFTNLVKSVNSKTPDQIKRLMVSAPDGYYSLLFGNMLKSLPSSQFLYSARQDTSDYPPTKIIFQELKRMYWVNNPNVIIIWLKDKISDPETFRLKSVNKPEFNKLRNHSTHRIELNTIHKSFFKDADFLHFVTSDGIVRAYPLNKDTEQYYLEKDEGGTWHLTGENIHYGLKLRYIFYIASENCGVFFQPIGEREKSVFKKEYFKKYILYEGQNNKQFLQVCKTGEIRKIRDISIESGLEPLWSVLFKNENTDYIVIRN